MLAGAGIGAIVGGLISRNKNRGDGGSAREHGDHTARSTSAGNAQLMSENGEPQAVPAESDVRIAIERGQTCDEVVAALGEPDRIVTLAEKTVFTYGGLKIVFINGRVTDID